MNEVGHIDKYYNGVGKIVGIPTVFLHEVLIWEDGTDAGIVIGYTYEYVEVLFFNPDEVDYSKSIFRSKKFFGVKICESYKGRVVNGLGEPIDGLGIIEADTMQSVFKEAPPIIERKPVSTPLFTGIKAIDVVIPIGRGQRELIIGDKKLGKTILALDSFVNQKYNKENNLPQVYGIYVLIGQKRDKAESIINYLREADVMDNSTVVVASADDPLVAQYLAPYIGCTIGEYYRDNGMDALIVYDDLSKHAKAYREISLLLERSPGRETYPGDIFYIHAGLLERAAALSDDIGGGTLTALPIVETLEDDITAFIPTNLISITDGQIYLDPNLFSKGIFPAINIGLSVSRVGSQAQLQIMKDVSKSLKLIISQYKELKKLVQLESSLSESLEQGFRRGELTIEALKQNEHSYLSIINDVIIFYGLANDMFLDVDVEKWGYFEKKFNLYINGLDREDIKNITKLSIEKSKGKIEKIIKDFKF